MLDDHLIERYARHLILPNIGPQGVNAFRTSKVLVAGAGGLGTVVLYYLAAAGVGQIHIIDNDTVALSNLQRQLLYTPEHCGHRKVDVAAKVLAKLNPDVSITTAHITLNPHHLQATLKSAHIVIDCLDNIVCKREIHDASLAAGKIFLYGSAIGWSGQLLTILPGLSACLHCFFEELKPLAGTTCAEMGVFSPVCGVIGALLASEALKTLIYHKKIPEIKLTDLHINRLLTVELLKNRFYALQQKPHCSFCHHLTPTTPS